MALMEMAIGHPAVVEMTKDAARPAAIPITPPNRLSATASARNCNCTSVFGRADRDAQTDLARSFRHGDEHDIHDAETADEERHTAD